MKSFVLVLAVVTLSAAQKAPKAGPYASGKQSQAAVQSYNSAESTSHKPYSSHGGSYQAYPSGQYSGGLAGATKPNYPQLLQDSRTLNHDGTINFQYAADNGLQQGETVDPDGTRRGFYSYIGADGKPLTVKYTAGKNGFVAEGAHLPRQPNVAAPQTNEEVVAPYQGSHHGGHGSHGGHGGHGGHLPSPPSGQYYGGAPSHYSAASGHGGPSPYAAPYRRPAFNPPSPYYDPEAARSTFGGQGAPQTQYAQSLPSFGPGNNGGRYQYQGPPSRPNYAGSATMHSHINPYTPVGPAGPYQGQFDLGNGGTFSINFEPGAAQEIAYGGAGGGPQQRQY